jgi:hypothetical protein
VTDIRITRQECADCFESLWDNAFRANPFDAICTLLRVSGLADAGWDPLEESEEAFKDYNWHLKAKSKDLSDKSYWRIGLLMYCQACEMSAIHQMLANLLRILLNQRYHMNPLGSLGRADKKRFFKWYPPSAKVKWHKLREMAVDAKTADLVRLIDGIYDDRVRNAFSHSDYIITNNTFRWTEGDLGGQLPLEKLDSLITNAFSFTGVFVAVRDRWLKLAAKMSRYHRWPNHEVLELLKLDGKLDGFRVHFSNGNSARFRRSPAGVDLMNVVIESDGTINFMVGSLDGLTDRCVVDGKEVHFGERDSVDSFPAKFRVVRNTLNVKGELSERTVLSGSHGNREEAKAFLLAEAKRYQKCQFETESGRWQVVDKSSKQHWLEIEDALA